MALDSFKLEKLQIRAYLDPGHQKSAQPEPFEAMFNPASFKRSYGIRWTDQQGSGNSGAKLRYARTDPSQLELTLVEDGTGVDVQGIPGFGRQSVEERIEQFLDCAYRYHGEIHEPNYLNVRWGVIDFDCRLRNLDVSYDLFDRDGKPLRAELRTTFVADLDSVRRAKKENKKSADLSHRRTVRAGDTLPLLTRRIYGTADPYLAVARFNQLDDFRHLAPGQTLVFPPRDQLAAVGGR